MENNSLKLKELLIDLCSTDEDKLVLEELCKKVVTVTENSFEFEDQKFTYEKSTNRKIRNENFFPKSFLEILKSFDSLTWYDGDAGLKFDEDGFTIAYDFLLEGLEEEEQEEYGGSMCCFAAYQNAVFIDESRKLKNGEDALGFISHGSCEWEEVRSADNLNYKQILLRMISDVAIETNYIDEICY